MHHASPGLRSLRTWLATLAAVLLAVAWAAAGTFVASDTFDEDLVLHPTGYTGSGGTLTVTVCIDPGSPNAAAMVTPVSNAILTWNALSPTSPNLLFGGATDIPSGAFDFESTFLHELGHCIGLGHPNLSSESGLVDPDRNYTKSTTGADLAYDLDDGADDVIGSSDDARGDDVNLHFFRIANDDPFTIAGTVDSTTYSRDVADLPGGHSFPANADRAVGALLGHPDTEAVMQQGQFSEEDQRRLNHDDVATLRYGMSGVDTLAGTSDDYTMTLVYGGMATGCDVDVKFDDTQTTFAVCVVSFSLVSGDHYAVTEANAFFNTGFVWHFSSVAGPTTTTTSTSSTSSSTSTSTSSSSTTSTSSSTTSSTSTSTTTTLPPPLCGPAPEPSANCHLVTAALKGQVQMKDNSDDTKDALKWKWAKGDDTALVEFKDPVNGASNYQLCVYDTSANPQPLLASSILPGGVCGTKPCWKTSGTSGFKMGNKGGLPQGITKMKLKAGVLLKAQVQAQGKGSALPMPALPLTLPVTVQLLAQDGLGTECWQTTYTTFTKNEPAQFKAKGP